MQLAFWLALLAVPALVYRDGYPLLAAATAAYLCGCLLVSRRSRPRALLWRRGAWLFDLGAAGWCEVELLPPAHCLPWLVCLRWRRPGQGGGRWLYLWPDSADPDALRRLRKRLRLAR
ncbi:protein YgfX [Parahaliea mediterranea]|uniref:Toxin CptA n=1 Tax=Parahaliea mediterranea TaxID=651086 RepID=A0A939INJ3_9GAMM|nr:protein YgfX [Parahaliea mediterranea]MBN7798183.1 hypothetical protein [Parahaliea mediterranea]